MVSVNRRRVLISCALSLIASVAQSAAPPLLATVDVFHPGSTIETSEATGSRVERGSVNGVRYEFYHSDGSGLFAGRKVHVHLDLVEPGIWQVSCHKDAISDAKRCEMKKNSLWVYAHRDGRTIVSIGDNHYPGSSVTIRIDGDTPISTSATQDGDFSARSSARIIDRLKSGSTITTRYMEWPYRSWVDQSWDLFGFNETLRYIQWAVKRIR